MYFTIKKQKSTTKKENINRLVRNLYKKECE